MPTNDFLTFASGAGANVITLPTYTALSARGTGFQAGIAQSSQLNRVWRQSSIIASMLAQFIVDNSGQNAVDDGTIATLEQNLKLAIQAVTRIKVLAPLNVFVSTAGNDANTGLTVGAPLRNIATALNLIYHNYDFNGFSATIRLAAGTYNEALLIVGLPVGCTSVTLLGVTQAPTTVNINATNATAINLALGANLTIDGLQVSASGTTGSAGYGIISTQSQVLLGNVAFGSCGQGQLASYEGSAVSAGAGVTLTFAGTNQFGLISRVGSQLTLTSTQLAFSGTPSYSQAFALCQSGAEITTITLPAITGTFTGRRFLSSNHGLINTNGAGVNLFPGSIAGVADAATYGLYI